MRLIVILGCLLSVCWVAQSGEPEFQIKTIKDNAWFLRNPIDTITFQQEKFQYYPEILDSSFFRSGKDLNACGAQAKFWLRSFLLSLDHQARISVGNTLKSIIVKAVPPKISDAGYLLDHPDERFQFPRGSDYTVQVGVKYQREKKTTVWWSMPVCPKGKPHSTADLKISVQKPVRSMGGMY